MRKEITFEQNSPQTCFLNIKNIFGFSTNYVEDKIKRHEGKWNPYVRKFEVPLNEMNKLAKDLQSIDRSFIVQQIPTFVSEMATKFCPNGNKVKKQILIDNNVVKRYDYIEQNILKSIFKNSSGIHQSKNYHKILIITPEYKTLTWMQRIKTYKFKKLKFDPNQHEICLKENFLWICSYETIWSKYNLLQKYCFQTIILDESQLLAVKMQGQEQSVEEVKRFLISRYFCFLILNKLYMSRLHIFISLLSIVHPHTNFSLLNKRYKKQNLSELYYLIKNCGFARELNSVKSNKQKQSKHYFDKTICQLSERGIEKIKVINKKNSQIDYKSLLQNPSTVKNKNQKAYLESVNDVLRQEKQQSIFKVIYHYSVEVSSRLVIIIQTNHFYRLIENYLCEQQITYCHYEHHHQILEFNKNSTLSVCLVKSDYLMNLNFSTHLTTKDETINLKLQSYEPQQYLCLSGVRNALFPDIDWYGQIRKKEQAIRQLFRYVHGDLVRHYFLLKGTYQQKWMSNLEQTIIKVRMNLKVKEDLLEEQENEKNMGLDQDKDVNFAFCDLNLAKVQEQYSGMKIIKGVTDIDEEFDKLQFEALQQKAKRQSKKKIKAQKARQKLLQKQQYEKQKYVKQRTVKHSSCDKIEAKDRTQQISSQQEYERFLQRKKLQIHEPYSIDSAYKSQTKNGEILDKTQIRKPMEILDARPRPQENNDNRNLGNPKDSVINQICEDLFKQGQTQQVQIIEVRKSIQKPKVPKPKSQVMKIILRPSAVE